MKKICFLLLFSVLLCGCSDSEKSVSGSLSEVTYNSEINEEIINNRDETDGEKIRNEYLKELEFQKTSAHKADFKPIENGYSVKTGNQLQNIKNCMCSGAVCFDNESGILYFTDLGGSDTLCKSENGMVTELVQATALCINLWGDYLYYICNTDKPVGLDFPLMCAYGDIYRYNIRTGENELFIETNANALAVTEKGIEYTAGEKYTYKYEGMTDTAVDEHMYHKDYDKRNISESDIYPIIESCLGLYYSSGKITPKDGVISLALDNDNTTELLSRESVNVYLTIYNDWLCTRNKLNSLYCLNLKTGEEQIYEGFSIIQDYIWIDEILYISDGSSLYKCQNGEKQRFYIEQPNPNKPADISVLQTDGSNIYAVTNYGKLYILELNETETVYMLRNIN